MAYLGVPILQDVSITFYHYSGIVRGSRSRTSEKTMAGGGEKEGFSLAPPPPPPPIVFSQFDVGSEFAWLVPVLIEAQTKSTCPKKPSSQAIT